MNLLGTALGPLFDARGIGREPESGAIALYGPAPFASVTQTALQFIDLAAHSAPGRHGRHRVSGV